MGKVSLESDLRMMSTLFVSGGEEVPLINDESVLYGQLVQIITQIYSHVTLLHTLAE